MTSLENLAPAGSMEALKHAVAAGADAVYLGCASFSARAGAGNFNEAELREAVAYAHLHHVRVHVTVNTLVKDGELDAVLDVLRLLNDLRVDGVLVQDLGVADLLRTCFPDLPAHASTQMALHNASGARFVRELGFTRAVMARECSAEDIAKAAAEGIEIEVFGHGAQCVSVSGECLFSSMQGQRSGNRGRCAQPCRLNYTYRGKTAAWLSPRDVCLRDDLPALLRTGACSVKLEGRLKRPEYVSVTAGSYRRAIDALNAGRFQTAAEAEQTALKQIFHRGGFMHGYFGGCEDAGVIDPTRVNHGGIFMGRVARVERGFAVMQVERILHDGDGLQLRGTGQDQDMIYSGHDTAAGEEARLRLRPDMRVLVGAEVWRLTDASQMAEANAATEPLIPITLHLTAMAGQPLTLTASDGTSSFTATGDVAEAARSRALTAEDAARSLGKLGGTCFCLADENAVTVDTADAFVAVSVSNALRRGALDGLTQARINAFTRAGGRECAPQAVTLPAAPQPMTVTCRTLAQLASVPSDARAVLAPEDVREDALRALLDKLPRRVWLALPTVCREETLDMLASVAESYAAKLEGLVLGSVGQLGHAWPLPVAAGDGIPVMNRRALALLLRRGCVFATASSELSGRELDKLMAGRPPLVVPAAGRVRYMLLHHCSARTYLGLTHGHASCRLCDDHAPDALAGTCLKDRRGALLPLLRTRLPEGCRVSLLGPRTLDVAAQVRAKGWPPAVTLTVESGAEAQTMMKQIAEGAPFMGDTFDGHWERPVE